MEKPSEYLYSHKCPKCKIHGTHRLVKHWIMEGKGKKGTGKKQRTRIEIYKCLECKRKWRRGTNLNLGGN